MLHFLRPYWGLLVLPMGILFWQLLRNIDIARSPWSAVIDAHLLAFLLDKKLEKSRTRWPLYGVFSAIIWSIIALTGPCWSKYPVPAYQMQEPRVILLDLSAAMFINDSKNNRLTQAKFIMHELFQHTRQGQWGLILFTGEAFVVAPLTSDLHTIDTLLSSLTAHIMPVGGYRLDLALDEGARLMQQAGYSAGTLLLIGAEHPEHNAMVRARWLAKQQIHTSVVSVSGNSKTNLMFQELAAAGGGQVFIGGSSSVQLLHWANRQMSSVKYKQVNNIPIWQDRGRWFLLPALLSLLCLFRRGALDQVTA